MMIPVFHAARSSSPRRGFSLIELLLAIFILGVGIISVAAVFPAGIIQQRRTQDDVLGPVIAEAAMATIRSKVTQADFGTLEEFGIRDPSVFAALGMTGFPNSWLDAGDAYTQVGDWPWLRPSMAAVPPSESPASRSYAGDIDIFSARVARASNYVDQGYPSELQWDGAWRTSEFALFGSVPVFGENVSSDPGAFLFGIPFNRARFGFDGFGEDPLVTVTQEERFWPAGTGFQAGRERPQYAWDCMFRRFQGRVQVAIFVYRVNAGNTPGGYAVCQDTGSGRQGGRPPMPARVDLGFEFNGSAYGVLTPAGADTTPEVDNLDANRNVVPNTAPDFSTPSNLIALDPYVEGWQSPGQWMLDPYGRIHRVTQGRRNKRQGPVRLSRPVPSQNPSTALYNPEIQAGSAAANYARWQTRVDEVRSIWFIPTTDRRGVGLEPIYVTVREL